MKVLRKKGFTLVELMIVIAIIGMLAAALTTLVPRIREMGRSARCKANLRNLAMAAQSWSLKEREGSRMYPAAGSWESLDSERSGNKAITIYKSGVDGGSDAWVSWTYGTSGVWPWRDISNKTSWQGNMQAARFDGERGYISVTNGCLWEYVGKDLSVYICEAHKSVAVENQVQKLVRSYVMNAYFGWDGDDGRGRKAIDTVSISGTASLRLMFAEMPGLDRKEDKKGIDTSDRAIDGVLQYNDEVIGFNHRAARKLVGHVAFADGHVETLIRPSTSSDDLRKLTKALCEATEIERDISLKMR